MACEPGSTSTSRYSPVSTASAAGVTGLSSALSGLARCGTKEHENQANNNRMQLTVDACAVRPEIPLPDAALIRETRVTKSDFRSDELNLTLPCLRAARSLGTVSEPRSKSGLR